MVLTHLKEDLKETTGAVVQHTVFKMKNEKELGLLRIFCFSKISFWTNSKSLMLHIIIIV